MCKNLRNSTKQRRLKQKYELRKELTQFCEWEFHTDGTCKGCFSDCECYIWRVPISYILKIKQGDI